MNENIKLWEEMAKETARLKESFLRERKSKSLMQEKIKEATAPIIEANKPIVEAIKKIQPSSSTILSEEELKELIDISLRHNVEHLSKSELKSMLSHMFKDSKLFDIFLTFVKLRRITNFSIQKIEISGEPIKLLIFYGMGNQNAAMFGSIKQTSQFIERLEKFTNFYDKYASKIRIIIADDIDEDDDEFEDSFDDAVSGNGLERLNLLYATKAAGNTSLDVINEANDIMKKLLKSKTITSEIYKKLQQKFD